MIVAFFEQVKVRHVFKINSDNLHCATYPSEND